MISDLARAHLEKPPREPDACTVLEVLEDCRRCRICQGSDPECDWCGGEGTEGGAIRSRLTWRCPSCDTRAADHDKPCCNPLCKGIWGTGCFHCHHPKYLTDVEYEEDPERQAPYLDVVRLVEAKVAP